MGITAALVNGDTWKKEAFRLVSYHVHMCACLKRGPPSEQQNVKECKYQILLASPEMCFKFPGFSIPLRNTTLFNHTMLGVFDEVHTMGSKVPDPIIKFE